MALRARIDVCKSWTLDRKKNEKNEWEHLEVKLKTNNNNKNTLKVSCEKLCVVLKN